MFRKLPALFTFADDIIARPTRRLAIAQPPSWSKEAANTALIARFVAHGLRAGFVPNLIDDRNAIDAARTS